MPFCANRIFLLGSFRQIFKSFTQSKVNTKIPSNPTTRVPTHNSQNLLFYSLHPMRTTMQLILQHCVFLNSLLPPPPKHSIPHGIHPQLSWAKAANPHTARSISLEATCSQQKLQKPSSTKRKARAILTQTAAQKFCANILRSPDYSELTKAPPSGPSS